VAGFFVWHPGGNHREQGGRELGIAAHDAPGNPIETVKTPQEDKDSQGMIQEAITNVITTVGKGMER
jgi:hypothetical protein